ncbi:insulin-like growth factor-binding protein 3 receptor isoform X3 [Echinops telfairi]|uniref:Insulin-like growth factor-binding protein 3 receptor isoform X3 n=1 Tax=Echinops telfairi TaxID=9371 RepID=A0AC55CM20_ECHTE|nr:insulin-like growth factor-binding protein 3 receptor isoform X3 [Echinops telfairi]
MCISLPSRCSFSSGCRFSRGIRWLSVEAQTPPLSMGSCQAGHNLHLCLAHHPPLVCATLILLLLGLSGLSLGRFLLTHQTGLRSPDIPQDWVSFLRSFGQLTLCPVNESRPGKWRESHVVGLLTTLDFGNGPDGNKTQTFQAEVLGSQMGLEAQLAGSPSIRASVLSSRFAEGYGWMTATAPEPLAESPEMKPPLNSF